MIPITRCSFCNRGSDHPDVELLVASKVPGVHICQMCLGVAVQTFVSHVPGLHKKFTQLLQKLEPRVAKRAAPR